MFKRTRKVTRNSVNYVKGEGSKILNTEEAKSHYSAIKDMASEHLDPRNVKKGRVETFDAARQRLNLSEDDIEGAYKNFFWRFYIFFTFFSIAFGIILMGTIKNNHGATMISTGIMFVFLAHMISASFRAFQIRNRELFSLKTWASNPAEWIPGNYEKPSNNSTSISKIK